MYIYIHICENLSILILKLSKHKWIKRYIMSILYAHDYYTDIHGLDTKSPEKSQQPAEPPKSARVPAVLCIVTDVSSTVAASQGLVRIYSRWGTSIFSRKGHVRGWYDSHDIA